MANPYQQATDLEAERLKGLFHRVPIGLYCTTPSGQIVDVNPALLEMLGYSDKESFLEEAAHTVYADSSARARWLAEMEEKSTVSGFETQWVRQDGSLIWVAENAHALRDENGVIVKYEGSAQDITLRRTAEASLLEEKARFEQLFAASPEAIVLCQNDGTIVRANEEFFRLFGYTQDEVLGQDVDQLVAPNVDSLQSEAKGITQQIADGETSSVDTVRYRKDGQPVSVSILAKPIQINGDQIALYGIYRDITARRLAEARLLEEKARFEQLFAASPEAIVLCRNDGTILRSNEEFLRLFGYTRDEVLGQNVDQLVAPNVDSLQTEAKSITQQIADGETSLVETVRYRKDGQPVSVSILAKPIHMNGNQIALYGIYRDITARKVAEAALKETHAKVERLHEAADALSAAQNEDEIYRITCEAAERVLGLTLGLLCIEEDDAFVCRTISPARNEGEARSLIHVKSASVKGPDLEHDGPMILQDPDPAILPTGIPSTSRSLISVPIGELGLFHAASSEPNAFTEDDARLLAILLGHTEIGVTRLRLQEKLVQQARHDALTGVFNRHYFNEMIAQEVLRATRYDHPIGLLMIDVDRFKEINDRLGHHIGDMVLKEIAAVLQSTLRQTDMIVRYGGDEFLAVLTESGEASEEAAVRVRAAVGSSSKLQQVSGLHVSVSVGSIFWHPEAGIPIEQALAAADSRMYEDKKRR